MAAEMEAMETKDAKVRSTQLQEIKVSEARTVGQQRELQQLCGVVRGTKCLRWHYSFIYRGSFPIPLLIKYIEHGSIYTHLCPHTVRQLVVPRRLFNNWFGNN